MHHANHSDQRYSHHSNPAIRLLNGVLRTLPLRSMEHDIVACAMLYLEGDLNPGESVERWWDSEDRRTRESTEPDATVIDQTQESH